MNTITASKKAKDVQKERTALRISLLRKGWNNKDLAKAINRTPGSVANAICGGDPSWHIRDAINKVLGQKIFVKRSWSRPQRKPLKPFTSQIPATLPVSTQ